MTVFQFANYKGYKSKVNLSSPKNQSKLSLNTYLVLTEIHTSIISKNPYLYLAK